MTSHYQNQAYQQESAPTEHLQQSLGFAPVYEQQQQRVPPGPTGVEYLRQPPTAPYVPAPPPPPLQQPQPVVVETHVHVHPVPVHQQQQQVPPCPADVTAPFVNPNTLPAPPPPPPPRPLVVCKCGDCWGLKTYCWFLLFILIGTAVPLIYVRYIQS